MSSEIPTVEQPTADWSTKIRNLLVGLVAIILSVAIFLGLRTQTITVSLDQLAQTAVPLEVALGNGKPTLIEFYADWCTTCQAMAEDMEQLRRAYLDRVNFVMLNVDNTKWLPEILSYRVDGIPHFAFLNQQGEAKASTIGEQPLAIMAANLDALLQGEVLPYSQSIGQLSTFKAPAPLSSQKEVAPRSHGS